MLGSVATQPIEMFNDANSRCGFDTMAHVRGRNADFFRNGVQRKAFGQVLLEIIDHLDRDDEVVVFYRWLVGETVIAVLFKNQQQKLLYCHGFELTGEKSVIVLFLDDLQKAFCQLLVPNDGGELIVESLNFQLLKKGFGGNNAMELPIVSRNGVDLAGVNGNDVTRVGNIGIIFYVNGCGSRNNIQKFSFVMPIGSIIVFFLTVIDKNATTDVILLISAGFKKYIRHNKHLSSNMVTYKNENVNMIFVFFS